MCSGVIGVSWSALYDLVGDRSEDAMRIATFNVENLDDGPEGKNGAPFQERLPILRAQLERLRADVLLLQEVHGQTVEDGSRQLRALARVLAGTRYEAYQQSSTTTLTGTVFAERNVVTLIPPDWTVEETRQIRDRDMPTPRYDLLTDAPDAGVKDIGWERPLLYVRTRPAEGEVLHLINCHFKSKNPTSIAGEGPENFMWRSAAGWAEGYFISSMKRVGAALGARVLIDRIFEADPVARIVLGGDLNAEPHEVPLMAIRGEVADHGNPALNHQTMYPCAESVPMDLRFTLYHHGRKNLLDHVLVSRSLIAFYRGAEIHNELVRDESVAFATDRKFPASDHAPFVAIFSPEVMT